MKIALKIVLSFLIFIVLLFIHLTLGFCVTFLFGNGDLLFTDLVVVIPTYFLSGLLAEVIISLCIISVIAIYERIK